MPPSDDRDELCGCDCAYGCVAGDVSGGAVVAGAVVAGAGAASTSTTEDSAPFTTSVHIDDDDACPSTCRCTDPVWRSAAPWSTLVCMPPLFECNSDCACPSSCANRVVQRVWRDGKLGLCAAAASAVELFRHSGARARIGFGLRATTDIPAGALLGEYVGVVVAGPDRLRAALASGADRNFLLCIREAADPLAPAKAVTCVDARHSGGLLRFVNHSCEPTASVVCVRVDSITPHLCFVAATAIRAGVEISVNYGEGTPTAPGSATGGVPCLCGAVRCKGTLPFAPDALLGL